MAQTDFPDCIEILDFFHVSEYVWAWQERLFLSKRNGRNLGLNNNRVEQQQRWLKQSQWQSVV
ncbi:MAG: hypothetical protein HC895_08275 [Leptolyngbyaceae cyanobacterium SM1_3_5]|nr:hypothetical protein [Leptolyngbyaceae cyanobacterium SM1_3_5]